MADTKISDMTAAVTAADADLVPIVQGGVNKKATVDLILDALTAARVATAIGSTAANLVYAGPASGAAAVPAARALVAADIPSLSAVYQPVDTTLTALAALGAGPGFLQVTGADTFAIAALSDTQVNTALGYTAANAASLASSALSGALPALDGSALTALNATNLTSGTLPDARFPAVLPAISGANLTNLPGGISELTAGVIPVATSGTAVGNSKLTMSGTNLGTATLYDGTSTGFTLLTVRGGPGQGTDPVALFRDNSLTRFINFRVDAYGAIAGFSNNGSELNVTVDSSQGLVLSGANTIKWSNYDPYIYGANDTGLARSAAGILKVTDGSTGYGSLIAASTGVRTANAAATNLKTISESITLSTVGLTTDSTADLLPANSIILSVVARITTTITTTTDWALGDATTAARFAAANATLTAGTTAVGLAHQQGGIATDAAGPVQIAAAKLRITCSGANPGAGAVRVTVTYLELTPPTS